MSLGRIALVAAGAAAGICVGYAIKSEKVRPVAVCAVKTGIKAKDWTARQFGNIKEDVKALAEQAREKSKSLISKEESVEETV